MMSPLRSGSSRFTVVLGVGVAEADRRTTSVFGAAVEGALACA